LISKPTWIFNNFCIKSVPSKPSWYMLHICAGPDRWPCSATGNLLLHWSCHTGPTGLVHRTLQGNEILCNTLSEWIFRWLDNTHECVFENLSLGLRKAGSTYAADDIGEMYCSMSYDLVVANRVKHHNPTYCVSNQIKLIIYDSNSL